MDCRLRDVPFHQIPDLLVGPVLVLVTLPILEFTECKLCLTVTIGLFTMVSQIMIPPLYPMLQEKAGLNPEAIALGMEAPPTSELNG